MCVVCVHVHGMCVGACMHECAHAGMCVHSRVYVCYLACVGTCVLAIVMITVCIVNRPTLTVQSSSEYDCNVNVKSLTLEW